MQPRIQKASYLIALVLILGGLVIAGNAHAALHDDPGEDCQACLVSASPVPPAPEPAPPTRAHARRETPPPSLPHSVPSECHDPRGPPA